jgi:hypothetical protein
VSVVQSGRRVQSGRLAIANVDSVTITKRLTTNSHGYLGSCIASVGGQCVGVVACFPFFFFTIMLFTTMHKQCYMMKHHCVARVPMHVLSKANSLRPVSRYLMF